MLPPPFCIVCGRYTRLYGGQNENLTAVDYKDGLCSILSQEAMSRPNVVGKSPGFMRRGGVGTAVCALGRILLRNRGISWFAAEYAVALHGKAAVLPPVRQEEKGGAAGKYGRIEATSLQGAEHSIFYKNHIFCVNRNVIIRFLSILVYIFRTRVRMGRPLQSHPLLPGRPMLQYLLYDFLKPQVLSGAVCADVIF